MLYYLFSYLQEAINLPGAGLFQYITFRAAAALLLSLLIGMIFGKTLILYLQKKQIGEVIRTLGLQGENLKAGTPTMGGILILTALIIPCLLFARISNVYIILLICSAIWLGTIGFIDDYIKVFRKNKEGLKGRFKIVGQVGLGIIIGTTMFYNENIVIREFNTNTIQESGQISVESGQVVSEITPSHQDIRSLKTTIPFLKNNELDYQSIFSFSGQYGTLILYILWVTFIITAVSNGANMTDGLDGLAGGTSAIIAFTLGIFAYISGNVILTKYLNIMYIPNLGEVLVFCCALVGACVGFLWYNTFPAQVFMGDTGSLSLGGIIAVLSIVIRKELLIPVLCGIFLVENLSVILQVSYFKYTKKKYGEGKRIFLMSPLHHHYQKKGIHENKIVMRFWIVGIFLAILTLATLKIR